MKRVMMVCLLICLAQTCAFARNVKVEALSDFSTVNPPKTWQVKTVEDVTIGGDVGTLMAGSIIEGKIENVCAPRRGKRNATFTFVPTHIHTLAEDLNVNDTLVGKYSGLSDVSAGSVAKQGAVAVGNKLADGFFVPGVAIVEGAVKNETGNRVKSAAVSLYESTPLSYMNKGKDLEISRGKQFVMNFKEVDD